MTETLQEYCDSRGVPMRVDTAAGVICGVKILGLTSRNGRSYLPEALAGAASLYEGAKVNVNHPKGNPAAPRDYRDRIGTIRNVSVRQGEGLFADLCFNPKHALAEQLIWDAEHAPENVGFSHNVQARTSRREGRVVVEAITRVQSVDLVADPATTRGLFESSAASATDNRPAVATTEELRRAYPELVEDLLQEQSAEIDRLRLEVERLTALEAVHKKQEIVRRLLREFHLPDPDSDDPPAGSITSEQFVKTLLAAEDERAIRSLIEERAALVRSLARGEVHSAKPVSRDQQLVEATAPADAKGFVEAIT